MGLSFRGKVVLAIVVSCVVFWCAFSTVAIW